MCVPYGKMLRGKIVPNTVTKTIHTDKVFTPDLSESSMEAFPNYSPIPSQIRMIKSFNRPVILVDDIMHPASASRLWTPSSGRRMWTSAWCWWACCPATAGT